MLAAPFNPPNIKGFVQSASYQVGSDRDTSAGNCARVL